MEVSSNDALLVVGPVMHFTLLVGDKTIETAYTFYISHAKRVNCIADFNVYDRAQPNPLACALPINEMETHEICVGCVSVTQILLLLLYSCVRVPTREEESVCVCDKHREG
jgi:hypothetical protein